MTEFADEHPTRRLWLVFFGEPQRMNWWGIFLRRGFRHVSAAAYFADQERWVHVAPAAGGLVVEVMRPDEFLGRYQQLLRDATVVLRIPSRHDRTAMPVIGWCTGTVTALLGVRCWALTPYALFRRLLSQGAELAEHDLFVRTSETPGRGPVDQAAA